MPSDVALPDPVPQFLRGAGNEVHIRRPAAHQRILRGAKHRFARFGYEGTSLADIAQVADISVSELLLHFDDKLGILMAVFNEGWADIRPRLQDVVIASVHAREAALSMLAVMMRVLERDEDFARLLLFEGRRPNPESGEIVLSAGYRWFTRLCTELVERGQRDGSFNPAYDPRVLASVLIGAVENLMRDRLLTEQEGGITPFTGANIASVFDALVSYVKPSL